MTPTIERFLKSDILIGRNDIEKRGFAKTLSEEEIIQLAIKHSCPLVVKNGKKGRWYLKGRGIPREMIRTRLTENLGISRDGVYSLLLPEHLLVIGITIDDVMAEEWPKKIELSRTVS
jgi:hypothetical protein